MKATAAADLGPRVQRERDIVTGQDHSCTSAWLKEWYHLNLVNRHQALKAMSHGPLSETPAIFAAGLQILLGCEQQQTISDTTRDQQTDEHELSDDVEITATTRKGTTKDAGAGEVQEHWTGEELLTGMPILERRSHCENHALSTLVINLGNKVLQLSIQSHLVSSIEKHFPALLRMLPDGNQMSSIDLQYIYQAIALHYEAVQKVPFDVSARHYVDEIAYYMLNKWTERYQEHQKKASLTDHQRFLNVVFEIAAHIELRC